MLTISILVISVKRNISKFKLIKSYLRLTMYVNLTLLFIKKYMLNKIKYDNFTS